MRARKRNTAKLPRWATYVAPKKRPDGQPSLEHQQHLLKTQMFHEMSLQMDSLVEDFHSRNIDEQQQCENVPKVSVAEQKGGDGESAKKRKLNMESFVERFQYSTKSLKDQPLLPVRIWSQESATLQNRLDRQSWIYHLVQKLKYVSDSVVIWLQQREDDNGKEEVIRQLYLQHPPQVSLSRRQWENQSLTQMMKIWSASQKHKYTIHIVWDAQHGSLHAHFQEWLVELIALHGIPIALDLVQDTINELMDPISSLPAATNVQYMKGKVRKQLGAKSWMNEFLEFGLDRRNSTHHHSAQPLLRFLLECHQQNAVNESLHELVPLLLKWKRMYALHLAPLSCRQQGWSLVHHGLHELRAPDDVLLRLRYVQLLTKRNAGENQGAGQLLALRLQFFLDCLRVDNESGNSPWAQMRLNVLRQMVQMKNSSNSVQWNELVILLDHCTAIDEFEAVLKERFGDLASEKHDAIVQLRRPVVEGLIQYHPSTTDPPLVKAPAILYQTLLHRIAISRLEWFRQFIVQSGSDDEDMGTMAKSFQYGINHLRIMGLIKENRRGSDISYEKVTLIFCSGD